MKLLLRGGFLFDSERRVFEKKDICVDNGVFADASDPSDGAEVLELSGKYIVPGLIDVHTHGRAGYDFNRHERINYKTMLSSYAKSGTTSVMATLASDTMDSLKASIDSINSARRTPISGAATILGIHLEGRYLNPDKRGAHDISLLAPPSTSELEELVFRMCPLPVHVSAAPEMPGGLDFFRTGKRLGATMGIAHSAADADTARAALECGAVSFTHLFNAMMPLNHRNPGNACVGLTSDAYAELICDGIHIHPEMVKLAYMAKGARKLVLITDSMEATGCPDGEYEIAGMPVTVSNGRAVTHDGAIAGSLLSLFDGVINLCRFSGASFADALVCATANPARMIGVYDRVGSIAPGKRGDFLVLDENEIKGNIVPTVESVYIGGISVR